MDIRFGYSVVQILLAQVMHVAYSILPWS